MKIMKKRVLYGLLCLIGLGISSCNTTDEIHYHSFSNEWKFDSTMHWHESNCDHAGLASNLEPHNFNDENICKDCGYIKPNRYFNFNFVSDFCELNNKNVYEEGEAIEVILTPLNGASMPNNIEVYINGNLTNNSTYSYDKQTGIIKLTAIGDILVRAMSSDNIVKYQVNEQQFVNAIDFSNKQFVQLEASYGFFTDYNLNYTSRIIEFSNDVVHFSLYNLYASKNATYSNYFEEYIERVNQEYNYYHYDTYDGWEKLNNDNIAEEFNNIKENNFNWFYNINEYPLSFEKLNGNFDELTCSYKLEFSTTRNEKTIDWKMQVHFLDGKLCKVNYYSEDSYSYFGYYNYSYNEITPVIPQEALNINS